MITLSNSGDIYEKLRAFNGWKQRLHRIFIDKRLYLLVDLLHIQKKLLA